MTGTRANPRRVGGGLIGSLVLAAALGTLPNRAAVAGPEDDTLNVAMARETDFVDVLHTNARESQLLSFLIYDTLLYSNPQTGEIQGQLAESWTWLDDRTVEFQLRQGVTFQNGEPFDADDVVFTIGFVTDLGNQLRQQETDFGNIASVEAVGPYTVRLHLNHPDPTAENLFSSRLIIYPDEYTTANGHLIHATAPIGTGPYRMTTLEPGSEYVLEANETYFGGVRPAPAIGTIRMRVMPEVQTQIAELISGGIDMALSLTSDDAMAVQGVPGLKVLTGQSTRLYFLSMDVAGRTGESPLQDLQVRQAISYAIDRQTIAAQLVGSGATPLTAHCNPAQNLCPERLPTNEFNPDRARGMLAEAGYQDGFEISLISSNDLRSIGEAIQGYLADVGITVRYDVFPLPAWRTKFIDGESTMSILGWGGGGGSVDVGYSLGIFFNQSATDYVRDQQISDWLAAAEQTFDRAERESLYRRVLMSINAQAYTVPLYGPPAVYVVSEDVAFDPPVIDNPDLSWVSWAE